MRTTQAPYANRVALLSKLDDLNLGRECATLTTLCRNGRASRADELLLDDCLTECRKRGKEEIFHAAQERAFSRPLLDDASKAQLIESAEHWEKLADEDERMAAWERQRGIDLCTPGQSPRDHKARTFRALAKAQRMEAETGIPHCMDHMTPRSVCAHKHGVGG